MKKKELQTGKYCGFHIIKSHDRNSKTVHIVFLNYVPVVQFNPGKAGERKLAAIDIVEKGLCTQSQAGNICGFHRNTVFKLLRTKKYLGIEAVLKDDRGHKSPFKYIGKVRSYIKKLLRKYPEINDQAIADMAAEGLKMEISRSAVARIRTEKNENKKKYTLSGKKELVEIAKIADAVDKEKNQDRQMELNFNWDKDVKKKVEECSTEKSPQPIQKSKKNLIKRLQEGEHNNFAGGLMHHLFLQEIGFDDIVSSFPLNNEVTFQNCDILETIFHSINMGISSIEALKLINTNEFGVLSGLNNSPKKETVRNHLTAMATQNRSADIIDSFAKVLLQQNFISSEVFFIDGHFLPYYGLNVIAKGYFTVRRLAMRGNELYAVTDIQGRPLFFMTESNEIDFRPIISSCANKLIEYGITRPIMVFDRGGYGIRFFNEINQIADFVTWAKYVSDKSINQIPDESFTVGIKWQNKKYLVAEEIRTVKESVQTAKKAGYSEPVSIELRMIILQNVESGKRIGIFTNNRQKPLYKIAFYMLNRWGESENVFKEMMSRFNLNYHPGYDIKELENQPLIDNPDIALINKAIRILNKEINEFEREILLIEAKQCKRKDKRRLNKIIKLSNEIDDKKNDIANFKNKLDELDDKISILEILNGKPMSRCDLEKKKLYDILQFMAYNSRERLVELFRDCYDDHRDVKPVLDMITKRGGYIKLVGQTLIVVLDYIQNKKHREAANRFCLVLNQKQIRFGGNLKIKLSFFISKYPRAGNIDNIDLHNLK